MFVRFVKQVLEAGMNPAQGINDLFGPIEVFPFALDRPVGRW